MAVHHLNQAERVMLGVANELLIEITRTHSHRCECILCEARVDTDVQEEEAFHVEGVTLQEDQPCER